MSNSTLRMLGILCLVAALVFAILNLKLVANMSTFGIVTPLIVSAIVLITRARRRG